MSLLSLVTKEAPRWASGKLVMNFDAILEDTLEASVTLSDYPIEIGSRSNDHRIKNPIRWRMTGGISNNPLSVSVTDFTGLISDVSSDNGVLSATAGLMAGWLKAMTKQGLLALFRIYLGLCTRAIHLTSLQEI